MFDLVMVEPYPLTSEPFHPVKEMANLFPLSLIKIYQIPHCWKITVAIVGTGQTVKVNKVNSHPTVWCCSWGRVCKPAVWVDTSHDNLDWGEHLIWPWDVLNIDLKKNDKMYLVVRDYLAPCTCPFFLRFSDEDDSKMMGFTVRSDAPRLEEEY